MNKRASGPPRRPRNPIAKAVRSPLYTPPSAQDKRWQERLKTVPGQLDGNGAPEDKT